MHTRSFSIPGIALLLAMSVLSGTTAFAADPAPADLPPVLQQLQKEGIRIVGDTLPAPKGMKGWAAYRGQQPLAFYSTADGKYVILGTLLDENAHDMTRDSLEKAVAAPMSRIVWNELGKSHWIADGSARAPRIVYVFTDPNCPYCNKFWGDARPWVSAGKVQLRHVIVGILTPSSPGKAAALLSAKDPSQALTEHEQAHFQENLENMASGHVRPLDDSGIKPLKNIPDSIEAELNENTQLMEKMGFQATPAIVWLDDQGMVHAHEGAPQSMLTEILGPR